MTRSSPENDLQRNVIELAEMLGYRAYHNARAKGNLRAKTAVGFQDLVLVRAPRLIFAELKDTGKYLTPEQDGMEGRARGVRTSRRSMAPGAQAIGTRSPQHFNGEKHNDGSNQARPWKP